MSDTIRLPRTDEMILSLGLVVGLASRAAEATNDEHEKTAVRRVMLAITEALEP